MILYSEDDPAKKVFQIKLIYYLNGVAQHSYTMNTEVCFSFRVRDYAFLQHWDREIHRHQNHNIDYRKTSITAQILATFLLGKMNLNFKMKSVKQDSKLKKKLWLQCCRYMFKIRCYTFSCRTIQFRQQ